MISKTLITLIVVACVATAGVGVALYYFLDDGGQDLSYDERGRLMIFGNANNDDYLDENDVEYLRAIIRGDVEPTPLADANQDGAIDEEDIKMVQLIIEKQNQIKDGKKPTKMEVFYLYPYAKEFYVGSIMYPLDKVAVVGTNVMITAKLVGATDKIVARHGGTVDTTLYSDLVSKPQISDDVFNADFERVTQLISQSGMFDAIITLDSISYVSNYKQFENIGVKVIRIAASDGVESLAGALTIGFMLGVNEGAQKYVEFADSIFDILKERIDTIPMEDRVTTLSVTMTNSVSGLPSDYYGATMLAGAINIADWTTTTRTFNTLTSGDTWMYNQEYDSDFIIHVRSIGYGKIDSNAVWNQYSPNFANTPAAKNGNYVIINGNMPVMIRTIYMAHIFYPELVTYDEIVELHQFYIDNYVPNLAGYDVTTDGVFIIRGPTGP